MNVNGSVYIRTQTVFNLLHPEVKVASQHCHHSMRWQFCGLLHLQADTATTLDGTFRLTILSEFQRRCGRKINVNLKVMC